MPESGKPRNSSYIRNFRALAQKWPSIIVTLNEVTTLIGGLIHRRTLAKLDSEGKDPANRFRVASVKHLQPDGIFEFFGYLLVSYLAGSI